MVSDVIALKEVIFYKAYKKLSANFHTLLQSLLPSSANNPPNFIIFSYLLHETAKSGDVTAEMLKDAMDNLMGNNSTQESLACLYNIVKSEERFGADFFQVAKYTVIESAWKEGARTVTRKRCNKYTRVSSNKFFIVCKLIERRKK